MKKQSDLSRLMGYAGNYRYFTYASWVLSAVSALVALVPFVYIWKILRDVLNAAPDYAQAVNIPHYGWMAVLFAVLSYLIYIAALMCSHLSAFRVATNLRLAVSEHLAVLPLGFAETFGSGKLRKIIHESTGAAETYLAHQLPDQYNAIATPVGLLVLLLAFDWRLGLLSLAPVVLAFLIMTTMTGKRMAEKMRQYGNALEAMSNEAVEYVRGIPVVKIFQQTVYSFKAFQQAIEAYSSKSEYYQDKVCRVPQSLNLTFTEGAFVFLVPVALFLAPSALAGGDFAGFVTNFAFYAVFSAILSTALARIMFASAGMMLASTALGRIDQVMCAPTLKKPPRPQKPQDSRVEFADVSFTYDGAASPALSHLSFTVEPGQTVALVGPSGGGKTTAASLIPRFWDATSGVVKVGGVDVTQIDPHVLMDQIAFVFQNSRLFKTSILENVRAARPEATRAQVEAALMAAQCGDILEKLPQGMDTQIGSEGTYLSGGEQQRVALARAILKDAPIVVLDEATAFADPENEALIQKALSELTRGRTVIMIAHRLSTVVGADQILVLDKGRIVEQGSHSVLSTAGGLYARMWADYNQAVQWKITSEREVE